MEGIVIDSKTKSLVVVLDAAKTTNDMDISCSYIDTIIPQQRTTKTNGTTPVTIVSGIPITQSPPVNTNRRITELTICNTDTAQKKVSVYVLDGSTVISKMIVGLGVDFTLHFDSNGWYVTNESGGIVTTITTSNTWAQVLSNGNISGGNNPTLSNGDKIISQTGNAQLDFGTGAQVEILIGASTDNSLVLQPTYFGLNHQQYIALNAPVTVLPNTFSIASNQSKSLSILNFGATGDSIFGSVDGGVGVQSGFLFDTTKFIIRSKGDGIIQSNLGVLQISHPSQLVLDSPTYNYTTLTPETVPIIDASNNFVSSTTTTTQLSYVDFTSSGQGQLNGKEGTITAGTTSQYWRGDKTFQTLNTSVVPVTTNKNYVTDAQLVVIGNTSGTNTGDQVNISGNAATVTTNANLTGVITSVGNATSITSQTGTGTKFVVDTAPTISGLILSAGTVSVSPIKMTPTSAALLTTATAGSWEIDTNGVPYYSQAASSRGVVCSEQIITLTSNYTLTNTTALQQIFNSTVSGALTVPASTSYFFECAFTVSSMSASSGDYSFGIGGTATITAMRYESFAIKTSGPATVQSIRSAVATATSLVSASTTTNGHALIKGIIRINGAGTIIPQIALGVGAAAVISQESYFKISPFGSNTVQSIGNWS